MASKYKLIGPPGHSYVTRDFKRWVLVFSDGDKMTLARKRYAVMVAQAMIERGCEVHIFEETVMRSIMPNDEVREDSFRTEITERVKLEMEAKRINN